MPLRVTLLGETRLELDGESLALPAKITALFCYLAVNRRRHSRDSLVELLWGEADGADQAANLRVALSKLRRSLGPFLAVERDYVSVPRDAKLFLDCESFWELCRRRGEAEADLEGAAELYRGDFMHGFYLAEAPRFEEWQLAERERLRQLGRECFASLSESRAAVGDRSGALEYALRLLALEPWHESAHRRVMRLRAGAGDFEAALRQFESCRELLERELGVKPTPATRRLHERILVARDRPAPSLPLPYAPLVGRERELATLRLRLARAECRLLTLTGTGGIGKTRLALELARSVRTEYLGGVHFVQLMTVRDRDGLVDALAVNLGVERRKGDDDLQALTVALRDLEALLVLDNFEQLADVAGDLLAHLLDAAPEVKLLVTSRQRLNLRREWVVGLDGLQYPAEEGLAAGASESERLFAQVVERVGAPGDDSTEKGAVARICRLLQGHPLAIELAAAATWRRSAAEIVAGIERGLGELADDALDLPERARSIRAVFDYSWLMLASEEREALARLSVFAGGFDERAAREVANAGRQLLEELTGKSLLRQARDDRFDFHPLVREYALAKLLERPDDAFDAFRRHSAFFLERTRDSLRHFWERDRGEWVERLRREQENLRVALEWLWSNDPLAGLGLVRRLWQFWMQWGQLREGRRWLGAMLDAAPEGEHLEERSEALNGSASLAFLQGDNAVAVDLYRRSLGLKRAVLDEQGESHVLNNLANVLRAEGDLGGASELYRQSLEIRELLGDRRGVASSLSNLGLLAERQGDLERARELYRQSLDIRQEAEDLVGMAISTCNLGFVSSKLGEYGAAREWFRQSLKLDLENGSRSTVDDSLAGLATVEAASGEVSLAAVLLGVAEELRRASGKALERAEQEELEATMTLLRSRMGPEALEAALQVGRQTPPEEALEFALSESEWLSHSRWTG